jgi:predicted aspartyl protease
MQNFKNQFLAAAVLLTVLPGLASAQGSCPLHIEANFPVTFVRGHLPVVTVTIAGQPVHLLLDTGSLTSFLTNGAYFALKLTGTMPTTGDYATGVAGTMQVNTIVLEDMKFGAVVLHNEVLAVTDQVVPAFHGKPLTEGILGDDIMQFFDVGLDLPDNRIIFYLPQSCSAGVVPWSGDYAPMPITRHKETLTATIDYGVNNVTLAAIIDTGASTSLITQQALARTGTTAEAGSVGPAFGGAGSHTITSKREVFNAVSIGAESFDNMPVYVANSPFAEFADAILGEDYLSTHRVFLSNSTDTAYLGLTVPPASN